MRNLEKRIKKIEKLVINKKHHGVFIILSYKDNLVIQSHEDKGKSFPNKDSLEKYIYNKYDCDKYIFLTINM